MKNWGWSIPDELLERTDLEIAEKVLIAIMGRLGALEKPIYPRHQWLAQKMGMSESGIRKILKRLQDKGEVGYEGRRWKIALYTLTDPKGRLSPTQKDADSPTQKDTHNKDIQSKDIQINSVATHSVAGEGKVIGELIDLFKEVNPSYRTLFGNKTQRACLKRMLKEHGEKKLRGMIEALPEINAKKYMPVTTTPYELERNMGKIKARMDQQRSGSQTIGIAL